MPSKKDCINISNQGTKASKSMRLEYEGRVNDVLDKIIGTEGDVSRLKNSTKKLDQKAYNEWKNMREVLKNHLIQNGEKLQWVDYKPDNYIYLLQDYMTLYFNTPGNPDALIRSAHPYRIIAVSRLIKKLINLHNSRWGKLLPWFERAMMPATMFAMRNDAFGHIYRFSVHAVNLKENWRRAGAPWKAEYDRIVRGYYESIYSYLTQRKNLGISPNMVMDGAPGLPLRDGRTVTFLGSKKRNGVIYHMVRDEKKPGSKPFEIEDDLIADAADIARAVTNLYVNRFMNDMLSGQARNIVWRDDFLNDEHRDRVFDIFKKEAIKAEAKQLHKGTRDVYIVKDAQDGYSYKFVLIKDKSRRGVKETVSAYIIAHKAPGMSNWLQYHSQEMNRFRGRVRKAEKDESYAQRRAKEVKEAQNALSKLRTIKELQKNNPDMFKDGFYSAKERRYLSHTVNLKKNRMNFGKNREYHWDFSNLQDTYMKNQPDEKLLNAHITESTDPNVAQPLSEDQRSTNFWVGLSNLRDLYFRLGNVLAKQAREELENIEKYLGENAKLRLLLEKTFDTKDLKKIQTEITNLTGIHSRVWVDDDGRIHTPNSHFNLIGEYYAPILFHKADLSIMIDNAIYEMEGQVATLPEGTEEWLNAKQKLEDFIEMRDYESNRDNMSLDEQMAERITSRQIDVNQNVYMKHRSEWTDPAMRRKDGNVHADYIDATFRRIHQNKLMSELFETIEKTLQYKDPAHSSMIDWLINRSKIAFADPTAYAGIKNWDYSYITMARWLNSHWPGKKKWTPEIVQKVITQTKSVFSAMLLGAPGALINRTQTMNMVIRGGWKYSKTAFKIIEASGDKKPPGWSEEKVNTLIDYLGIDEITNMFMDVLSHGTDIELRDAGLINFPGSRIQWPITPSTYRYLRLVYKDRQKYIDKKIPGLDRFLGELEYMRVQKSKKALEEKLEEIRLIKIKIARMKDSIARVAAKEELARSVISKKSDLRRLSRDLKLFEAEEKALRSSTEKRKARDLRENFLDLLLTEKKDNKRKVLEHRFRKIVGEVGENRMGRMVAWKLSWWFNGFGKDLFTFTGGERFMRRHAAIQTLLMAQDAGWLGADQGLNDDGIPNIFLTPEAVRLARNAVANTMFGMSPVHLSESFSGMGAQLGLYKAYPVQQMLHDWRVVETFFISMDGYGGEMINRIVDAFSDLRIKAFAPGKNPDAFKYNPEDKSIDHDALVMGRFLYLRVAASALAIFSEMIPFVRGLFRSPFTQQFSSMIRGGENPAARIAFRMLVNLAIFAAWDDDEMFANGITDVIWDTLRLLFPVFLTFPLFTIDQILRD